MRRAIKQGLLTVGLLPLAKRVHSLRVSARQTYPAFVVRNLSRALAPRTFNDRLYRKMLFDRRPLLTTFADKAAAREYVASSVGSGYLTTAYAITDDPSLIAWGDLPREYVCKVTHASGGVIIVSESAEPTGQLPSATSWGRAIVHPDHFSRGALTRLCHAWLARRYGWGHPRREWEWAYAHVPPRVLVEESLLGPAGEVPADYKLFVFNGVCRLIQVDSERFKEHTRNLFSPAWEPLDVRYGYPRVPTQTARPRNLDEMIAVAERLGRGVDFVRVDLYDLGDRVLFGELTNYPEAATMRFEPAAFDQELGTFWSAASRAASRAR